MSAGLGRKRTGVYNGRNGTRVKSSKNYLVPLSNHQSHHEGDESYNMKKMLALIFLVPIFGFVLVACGDRLQDKAGTGGPPAERLELESKRIALQAKRLDLETKMLELAVKRFEFESKRFESMARRRPTGSVRVGKRGRPMDAIADLNEVISLNPKDSLSYAQRSRAYRRLGMLQRAIEDLDEAIRINPQFGAAYVGRARLRTLLSMDAQASHDVNRAEELGFDTTRLKKSIEKLKQIR